MLIKLIFGCFALCFVAGVLSLINNYWLKSSLEKSTGLSLSDVIQWANENINAGGFDKARVLKDEENRVVVAVIKPPKTQSKGTPEYSVCEVSKSPKGVISVLPRSDYGIGIK